MRQTVKTCGKCYGRGMWRGIRLCKECDGIGQLTITAPVEGEHRAGLKLRGDYDYCRRTVMAEAAGTLPRADRARVADALKTLYDREPERVARCAASLRKGRIQAVLETLISYAG